MKDELMQRTKEDGLEQFKIETKSAGEGQLAIGVVLVVDDRLVQDRLQKGSANRRFI